ncbi:hypothetical protein [Halobiforma nitratireducens]|nr:hypothetical protein [Halobiforma nitratireducens]
MVAGGAPAVAAGDDAKAGDESIHALEDGEELYLVFGADLGEMTLEEYIESHASGDAVADAEVTQYQDVDQVNINQMANATSISIDGGEATAIQEATQQNDNVQFGDASASSVEATEFEDVGTVTVVIGNGDGKHFDGWGVADKKGDKADIDPDQAADAEVTQVQEVGQLNYNEQNVAFAIAENESEAIAMQYSEQANQNLQQGVANATNVYMGGGEFDDQSAQASVEQGQSTDQMNVNEQDGAVAIAVGNESTATAIQFTEQTNLNQQIGEADAENVISAMPGMNVATAGFDGDNGIVQTEETLEKLHSEKDDKDKEHHKKGGEEIQTATSEVTQEQGAEQLNVNLQNTALAMATNGSDATAIQISYQQNINAQVGFAEALNVYAGPGHVHDGVIASETTSVSLGGDEVEGVSGIAYDYDAAQTNDVEQHASAQIEQVQFVTQENVNEQQAAIAVADDEGSADSAQLTIQENENVQFTSVAATNVWAAP